MPGKPRIIYWILVFFIESNFQTNIFTKIYFVYHLSIFSQFLGHSPIIRDAIFISHFCWDKIEDICFNNLPLKKIYLFIGRQNDREEERKQRAWGQEWQREAIPICWLTPQVGPILGLDYVKSRCLELHHISHSGWQGPKYLNHLLWLFWILWLGSISEVEKLGLEWVSYGLSGLQEAP